MDTLLSSNRDFNGVVKRNIVSLRQSVDLMDDINDGDPQLTKIAYALENEAKRHPPSGIIARGFHYSTAVGYPFEVEPWQASRYSNGSFPIWYGSLDLDTAIYETCYHVVKELRRIDGLNEVVHRERAVYDVSCRALLIDLVGKETVGPELIGNEYSLTQAIGQRLRQEGHPGLIAPSARRKHGENAVIFKKEVLSEPQLMLYLTYKFNPMMNVMVVERTPGTTLMTIHYD